MKNVVNDIIIIVYHVLTLFITNTVIIGSYYKALYSYDPHLNSPNPDGVEEELAFDEDDIILVCA